MDTDGLCNFKKRNGLGVIRWLWLWKLKVEDMVWFGEGMISAVNGGKRGRNFTFSFSFYRKCKDGMEEKVVK